MGEPQQVGTIYKIYGDRNEVLPLFGRKNIQMEIEIKNIIQWQEDMVKMRVVSKRRGDELGTNDVVFVNGYGKDPYRVTIYETDFPQYIPYL